MTIYHLSQHVSPILRRCLFPESLGLFGNWPLKSANDSINLDTIYYYYGKGFREGFPKGLPGEWEQDQNQD